MMMSRTARSTIVTAPVTEPVTIHEIKRHVEIATNDTNHDVLLLQYITAAREQWERDTGKCLIARTLRLILPNIGEFQFAERPVTAITSIRYYPNDTIETLSSAVYQLDAPTNSLRLGYNQVWPSWAERWDAWEINYTAGDNVDSSTVPAVDKQAILLYAGYLFRGNRGDDDKAHDLRSYESMVLRHMRSTYP
jgi:uncharacterized phiE125 gp8 family phage protein